MAELYSQYVSGIEGFAGTMIGSSDGASGLNIIVDRLNIITPADNFIAGSLVSGLNTIMWPGSAFPECFAVEARVAKPTDGVERRLWILL